MDVLLLVHDSYMLENIRSLALVGYIDAYIDIYPGVYSDGQQEGNCQGCLDVVSSNFHMIPIYSEHHDATLLVLPASHSIYKYSHYSCQHNAVWTGGPARGGKAVLHLACVPHDATTTSC